MHALIPRFLDFNAASQYKVLRYEECKFIVSSLIKLIWQLKMSFCLDFIGLSAIIKYYLPSIYYNEFLMIELSRFIHFGRWFVQLKFGHIFRCGDELIKSEIGNYTPPPNKWRKVSLNHDFKISWNSAFEIVFSNKCKVPIIINRNLQ